LPGLEANLGRRPGPHFFFFSREKKKKQKEKRQKLSRDGCKTEDPRHSLKLLLQGQGNAQEQSPAA
jgi:hypothetical protein